ncbi:hypothetical protein RIN67_03015 [Levilactobacillus namurensis]|uniref:hypothetical protein n=1 Tax=Levilactobacillus namurensis TaxID=380393 RepID=UPI000467D2EA|nr:hypothetical protein [Levilactobacillus namurensis]MDT7019320.1 hypothetical protein [Levilactobacillus namurensis]WNN66080.1 hypothetical protein RIN67_03015 [Levilactobacillus namurensis]
MKAWICSAYDPLEGELAMVAWGETAGKAKSSVVGDERLGEAEFLEIKCRRAAWADDMSEMPWEKFEIEKLRHGWSWYLPDGRLVDSKTVPLIEKFGGTVSEFYKAYVKHTAPLGYSEDGFYEEK